MSSTPVVMMIIIMIIICQEVFSVPLYILPTSDVGRILVCWLKVVEKCLTRRVCMRLWEKFMSETNRK